VNTRILFSVLCLFLLLPWAVFLTSQNRVVGMYLQKPHTIIENESDVYDCMWHFWWVRTAIDNGEDPRAYRGTTLAWHNIGWLNQLFAYISGAGYNFMLFASSLFSGYAAYMLARSWSIGRNGSLITGIIVIWMPVRLVRMYQHYPIASIGFILLAFFFMRKWMSGGGRKNLIFLFICSLLAVMESLYHGLIIGTGFLIVSFISGKNFWKRSVAAGALAAAGCMIGSLWFFTAPEAFGQNPGKDWKEAVYWAAEPQSFIMPSILGEPMIQGYMPSPFEGVVSPGATVAFIALLYCWKKRSWKSLLAVLAIMILSWGPLLKIDGVPTFVPLPYMLLVKIPWLSAARAPSRLAILTGIMAALAAGAFVEKRGSVTGWLLTFLIMLEIVPVRLHTIETTVPGYYSTRNSHGITLEIPSSDRMRRYSLFEIADGAPRIVKYLARGGEQQMLQIPETLQWGSTSVPCQADIVFTGAEIVVYNRWMFSDSIRLHYDVLYKDLFPEPGKSDSVWVWTSI